VLGFQKKNKPLRYHLQKHLHLDVCRITGSGQEGTGPDYSRSPEFTSHYKEFGP